MGEPSPCLVRSLSQPSNSSPEPKEIDPLRALRSSVSFGRYVSDTSSWEKWSCFSNNNKYLEEAEKISKPGSVAEKKALLEAHFNKIRAKKANMETNNYEPSIMNKSSLTTDETHEKRGPNALDPHIETKDLEMDKNGEFEMETKPIDSVEKVIKCEVSKLPDIEREYTKNVARKQEKMPIFDNAKQGNLVSTSKKKQTLSSTKFITDILASKFRSSIKLSPSKKEDSATQTSKKTERASLEKRASTLKSIHMSVDNSSRVGESITNSTTMVEKTGDPKGAKIFSKISRDTSIPRQSSTRASVAGNVTQPSAKQKSIKSLDKPPVPRSTAEPQSPPIDSKTCVTNLQSPTVASSPFSLRCEGRVAKRKEFFQKLEEKQKASESEKVLFQQAKSKVQLITQPQTAKHAKHLTSSMVIDYGSRPLWRSNKIDDDAKAKEKSTRSLVRSSSTMLRKNKIENASPNIQRWL